MTPAASVSPLWEDAALVAALFALDPVGLGGVALRGGPGSARDGWLALVRTLLPPGAPVRRAPLHIDDDRLLGGLDLAASLSGGRPIAQRGLLAQCDGGVVLLPMAERIEDTAAGRLASALDQGAVTLERDGLALYLPARLGVIALDEGLEPEEGPPRALLERLAFHIDLSRLADPRTLGEAPSPASTAEGRRRLAQAAPASEAIIEGLCAAAAMMGLGSARAPLLALRAARAHAALRGRSEITAEDAAVAARLVLAPRAGAALEPAADDPAHGDPAPAPISEEPPPRSEAPDETSSAAEAPSETDMVVEAIQAALPADLLQRMTLGAPAQPARARGRGLGARTLSARRGRPAGSRQGALESGERLNLVETLRAATPWQRLRGGGVAAGRVRVRQEDFRIRRFVRRAESTTIFVVDASGSSAFQRLAEAKGAVELLLAKAYVSRTRVALIAFRGTEAEVLLPPTRSLTRAKRRLADLPGGGGTPLAAGMDAALALALAERAMDRTPMLVILTDGRANIGRGGAPGRTGAEEDALAAARRVSQSGVAAAYLDTSPRPGADGDRFARAMGAVYAPLPYANAAAMFDIVGDLRGGSFHGRRQGAGT